MASAATASRANEPAIPHAIAAALAMSVALIMETLHILYPLDVCVRPVLRQLTGAKPLGRFWTNKNAAAWSARGGV
jgi:hypothetical protein